MNQSRKEKENIEKHEENRTEKQNHSPAEHGVQWRADRVQYASHQGLGSGISVLGMCIQSADQGSSAQWQRAVHHACHLTHPAKGTKGSAYRQNKMTKWYIKQTIIVKGCEVDKMNI